MQLTIQQRNVLQSIVLYGSALFHPISHKVLFLACFLMCLSAAFWINHQNSQRDTKRQIRSGECLPSRQPMSDRAAPPPDNVSSRCMKTMVPLFPEYFSNRYFEYPYDPNERRDGWISLGLAENKLSLGLLAKRLAEAKPFSHLEVLSYSSFLGMFQARRAAAYFLAKWFAFPDAYVRAEHIAIGSGASGILRSLFYLLGEDGDACLIPAPYYAAYEVDMSVVSNIIPIPVYMKSPLQGPTSHELEMAYSQARKAKLSPRFLLMSNPNNPLGVIYTKEKVQSMIQWARSLALHTIVDEIYALSTHRDDSSFSSVIRALDNRLNHDVHMVWSLSKDFGASGLRIGYLYTQNDTLLKGLAQLNIFSGVSNYMQMTAAELLKDDRFVIDYLAVSRRRLAENYRICVDALEAMSLSYTPAVAGMYVYVDFTSLFSLEEEEPNLAWERRLAQLIMEKARIVLTPGERQRDSRRGMFRICYASESPDVLQIAMDRLSRLVAALRKTQIARGTHYDTVRWGEDISTNAIIRVGNPLRPTPAATSPS